MRHKSFPYYVQWIDIFGKDRATGENTVVSINIVNEMLCTAHEKKGETGDKCDPHGIDTFEVDENISVCKLSESGVKSSSKGKKRKSVENEMSAFVESIREYMKGSD
ncbi:hypothetical protein ACS0TY_033895 [Phlomoides rotata]